MLENTWWLLELFFPPGAPRAHWGALGQRKSHTIMEDTKQYYNVLEHARKYLMVIRFAFPPWRPRGSLGSIGAEKISYNY